MTKGCSWRRLIGAVAFAAIGCGSVSPLSPDGGAGQSGQGSAGASAGATGSAGASGGASGGAGQGGAGGAPDAGTDAANPCHGLTESACATTSGCKTGTCAGCNSTPTFSGCYQPATEPPPPCPGVFCPPPPPVACSALTETMCLARTDCRADYCPGCQAKSFVKCSLPNDPQPQCPAIKCVAPCSSVTTLADCEARSDCHSVFFDPGTCGCAAAGCCAHFQKCVDGDKAACAGTVACTIVKPYCELPYVVSFSGSCYEGCVKQTDCAP